jgi:LysR family transcriptional regulator, regulator for bpeEF and oprC
MDTFVGVEEFVRTVESKSFVSAAATLGITASGVSKAVARLEARLGVRLLTRTTRSLGLTPEGARFFERCKQMVQDFAEARAELGRGRGQAVGVLRLELPTSFGTMVVAPELPRFAAAHPQLRVDVSFSERITDLAAEGIDLAVRIGELPDSTLVAREAGRFELVTCAAPVYWRRAGMPRHPRELQQHNCLNFFFPQSGRPLEWLFEREGDRVTVPVKGNLRFNHGEALVTAAMQGAGVVHLPAFIATHAIQRNLLKPGLLDWRSPGAPISIVFPQNRQLAPKVRACVDFLLPVLAAALI